MFYRLESIFSPKPQFSFSLFKQLISLWRTDMRGVYFLRIQNITHSLPSEQIYPIHVHGFHRFSWIFIDLLGLWWTSIDWIYVDLHWFSWISMVSSRTLFLSSVRQKWWGLNPTAGTPPLDLFFFRPDKSPGLPSSHNPILHSWFFPPERWTPWVPIKAWEFSSFRVCRQGSHNK